MKRYSVAQELGNGAYGVVFKAMNTVSGILDLSYVSLGEVVAIKKMKRKFFSWEECVNLREVQSLKKLNHENIVKLKEVIRENNELYFVFEFMDQNLYELIKFHQERSEEIEEHTIKDILLQILRALFFIHSHGYFHRDVKPENFLCASSPETGYKVKLADFGLAREIRSLPPYTEYVSTRWYRAPELLLHSKTYNSPADIWAAGCILAELIMLLPLFAGRNEVDQLMKICGILGTPRETDWPEARKLSAKTGFQWPYFVPTNLRATLNNRRLTQVSNHCSSLLLDMLQFNPFKRPSAKQALGCSFLNAKLTLRQNSFKVPVSCSAEETFRTSEDAPLTRSFTKLPPLNQIRQDDDLYTFVNTFGFQKNITNTELIPTVKTPQPYPDYYPEIIVQNPSNQSFHSELNVPSTPGLAQEAFSSQSFPSVFENNEQAPHLKKELIEVPSRYSTYQPFLIPEHDQVDDNKISTDFMVKKQVFSTFNPKPVSVAPNKNSDLKVTYPEKLKSAIKIPGPKLLKTHIEMQRKLKRNTNFNPAELVRRMFSKRPELTIGDVGEIEEVTVGIQLNIDDLEFDPSSPTGLRKVPRTIQELVARSSVVKRKIEESKMERDDLVNLLKGYYEKHKGYQPQEKVEEQIFQHFHVNPSSFHSKYITQGKRNLGKGAQGVVVEAISKDTKKPFAVKVMEYKFNPRRDEKKDIETEISFLSFCTANGCKNIVSVFDCFHDEKHKRYHLVMDKMASGLNKLVKEKYIWKDEIISYTIKEILKGLNFLHTRKIMHRDIKSANVLYNTLGEIKLADFGFVEALTLEKKERGSIKGSPFWLAPEMCRRTPYTHKIDIWALGVLCIELGDGKPPHHDPTHRLTPLDLFYLIASEPPPKLVSHHGRRRGSLIHHFLEVLFPILLVLGCIS
eukprot:augustus_masked-scaffold_2-processed-gene-0.17-mRNA-1 protein AED:0.17 eAED:0.18 QI:0/0/0/1/1/1/2/0/907